MIDLWTKEPSLVSQVQGCFDARSVDGSTQGLDIRAQAEVGKDGATQRHDDVSAEFGGFGGGCAGVATENGSHTLRAQRRGNITRLAQHLERIGDRATLALFNPSQYGHGAFS